MCFPLCEPTSTGTRNCSAGSPSEAPASQRTVFLIDWDSGIWKYRNWKLCTACSEWHRDLDLFINSTHNIWPFWFYNNKIHYKYLLKTLHCECLSPLTLWKWKLFGTKQSGSKKPHRMIQREMFLVGFVLCCPNFEDLICKKDYKISH